MKQIDIESWDRKEHYFFFKDADYGHYNIGTNLDISYFKRKVKEQGIPFSFAMTYAVMVAMNEVEDFRYRVRQDQVILHEKVHPSFTYIAPNMKYFKMVTVDLEDSIEVFAKKARKKALEQTEYFPAADLQGRDDFIFLSSLPKVAFTHLTHTMSFNKKDTIPRLTWGKYFEQNGEWKIPLNVQAHHAFVDGEAMGKYFETLQKFFDEYH